MTITSALPSPQAQTILDALREAEHKSLERKRRLGQHHERRCKRQHATQVD